MLTSPTYDYAAISLLKFLKTCNVACMFGAMTGIFSKREVSLHNSPDDAWVVVNGRVFDVSGFLPSHPGGLDVLADHLGADVGNALKSPEFHQHSNTAYEILEQCCIGVLEGSEVRQ